MLSGRIWLAEHVSEVARTRTIWREQVGRTEQMWPLKSLPAGELIFVKRRNLPYGTRFDQSVSEGG
ncbi:hypothetical protein EFS30_06975 [Levilactobacillus parabrevis]|nr:hypothetical protein [Levilactobacillus parabrevis]MCT4490341.1 hypothetical protein [Levilactobacillus parabrevis]